MAETIEYFSIEKGGEIDYRIIDGKRVEYYSQGYWYAANNSASFIRKHLHRVRAH